MADKPDNGVGCITLPAEEKLGRKAARELGTKSLRARLLILMAALIIIGVISQSALINSYLLRDFRQLEVSQVSASMRLIQLWLDRFVQPMEGLARELATSGTLKSPNSPETSAHLKSQLLAAYRVDQGFDVAAIYDANGDLVFVQGFDKATMGTRVPRGAETDILAQNARAQDFGKGKPTSGWTAKGDGLYATAGHPLITDEGRYTIVLGMDFDASDVASLDELSKTHISYVDGANPPETGKNRPHSTCTRLSPELNEKPTMLCVQLQESIFLRGQASAADLRLSSLVGFIVLMLSVWWFTDRSLLRRLAGLTTKLESGNGRDTHALEHAMLEDGKKGDEVSKLSSGLGSMLGRVRQAEIDLRERERSFRVLAESSGSGIFVIGDSIRYANPFAAELSGYSIQELLSKQLSELIHEDSQGHLAQALERGNIIDTESRELRGVRQNGTLYWARLDVARIEYHGEAAMLVTLYDITEQRHLEQVLEFEKQNLHLILSSIHDGIVSVDHAGAVRFINPAAQRLTGIPIELANGSLLEDVVSLKDSVSGSAYSSPILTSLAARGEKTTIALITTPKGQECSVEVSVSQHDQSASEGRQGAVMIMRDVSDLRQLTETLAHQASHDDLTGLINRREFSRRLLRAISRTRDDGVSHALCYLDLDQFKLLNDTCGHHAGDMMLREVANALLQSVAETDTLARLGGDEFGVLLSDTSVEKATSFAEHLRGTVANVRFQWNGQNFSVDASIGIVMLTDVSEGIDEALALADTACYMAKDLGRNRVQVYRTGDVGLQDQLKHMRWATRLKEAVEQNRFLLFAQAIAPVSDTAPELHAFEALVRMHQPDGCIVTPEEFLSAAERYQMMNHIDRWVVCTALEALKKVIDANQSVRPLLFINLSGQSLGDENFRLFLLEQLDKYADLAKNLVFEVTESAVIYSLDRAKRLMDDVYARGSAFALDDFGTGMSTFSYLKELRVDYLKIAGCFVKNVADPLDAAVCQSFTDFARMMNVQVIAEWIEDETILKALRDIGVDYGQGWHFGRPGPIDDVLRIVKGIAG